MVKVTLCYTVTTGRSGHWERHHIKITSILLREQILGDDCNTRIGIRCHNMGQPGRTCTSCPTWHQKGPWWWPYNMMTPGSRWRHTMSDMACLCLWCHVRHGIREGVGCCSCQTALHQNHTGCQPAAAQLAIKTALSSLIPGVYGMQKISGLFITLERINGAIF